MPKKNPKDGKPKVNKDLEGFNIKINEFGEIKTTMDVDKLNDFLNKNVADKKLKDQDLEGVEEEVVEEEKLFEDIDEDEIEIEKDEEA